MKRGQVPEGCGINGKIFEGSAQTINCGHPRYSTFKKNIYKNKSDYNKKSSIPTFPKELREIIEKNKNRP